MATPSELFEWQESYIYLFYVYGRRNDEANHALHRLDMVK